MFDAPVTRTPLFQLAVGSICKDDFDQGLEAFASLRDQYTNDPHSAVEIDRWMAYLLSRSGKMQDAYRLLQELGPRLERFQYDLSSHYFEVVTLQKQLGKLDELQEFCNSISGHFRTSDALGHLDWILEYASSISDARATNFMYTVVAVCAIQLGLDLPQQGIMGDDFRTILKRCHDARESAEQRYRSFWNELQQLISKGLFARDAKELVESYVRSEPCPLFGDNAMLALRHES